MKNQMTQFGKKIIDRASGECNVISQEKHYSLHTHYKDMLYSCKLRQIYDF